MGIYNANFGAALRAAALGAALRGDYAYCEVLIQLKVEEPVSLCYVAEGLVRNNMFKTKSAMFYYLLHCENPSLRSGFIKELLNEVEVPLSKEIKEFLPKAQKQIQEIFYFKNKYNLSIHQAMVMWGNKKNINPLLVYMPGNREAKENINRLSLWVLQVMPQLLQDDAEGKRPALNVDILLHITRYLFPALQMKSFEDISFKVIRYFLTASIDHYVSPISLGSRFSNWMSAEQAPPRLHLARAQSFQKESQLVESKKELARLCIAQSALFK